MTNDETKVHISFFFEEDRDEFDLLNRRMQLLMLRNSHEYLFGYELDDLEELYADVVDRPYL